MAKGSGIGGSGIFGGIGLGTVIQCKSEDNSYYCNFMKFMNVFFMFLVLIGIVYYIWTLFIAPMFRGKKMTGGSSSLFSFMNR